MRTGLFFLLLGYMLSQFYRAFLAVMAPVLEADIGASAGDLARASGLWFLGFALLQIPVGWALDRIGPRRTAAVLLGLGGGGGAALFAVAQGPVALNAAMFLIGVGCAPVLMASYYIFARSFPPAVFATMAGVTVGLGSLGNLASALPLAWAVEAFGWRETVAGVALATLAVALAVARLVQDPPRLTGAQAGQGSVLDLLKMPAIWLILPMLIVNYAPSAGLRGLWVGPYLQDVHGLDATGIGQITLVMALAMVLGNFAYGPADRIFGTRKWVVFGGNMLGAACLLLLWAVPGQGLWLSAALLAAVGFFGASFPLIMAHGRSFFPPHLVGRGVTLLNLFSVGSVGVFQLLSGRLHGAVSAHATEASAPYSALFLFFALSLLLGCLIYAFSRDRMD